MTKIAMLDARTDPAVLSIGETGRHIADLAEISLPRDRSSRLATATRILTDNGWGFVDGPDSWSEAVPDVYLADVR